MAGLSSTTSESHTLKANWTRLVRLLMDEGTHALREYLLSVHPTEEIDIVLSKSKVHLQRLKKKGKIFKDQWEMLFPSSGDSSDINSYDITLLHLLLREICNLKGPATAWHVMPEDSDTSPEASITRIKCVRNKLSHSPSTEIATAEFEDYWNKISMSLVSLYQEKIGRLKNGPIDQNMQHEVEEHVRKWKSFGYEDELSSCLPDEVPHVFGRLTEIKKVIDAVQSGSVSVVLITGGPGIGKTSVANEAAHALDGSEDSKTVLFCSLRSKATLNDVAIKMVLACDKNHAQLPDNPKLCLLNWSKQPMQNVTFVLDNADDVLNSDDRDEFLSLLSDMRIFSRKKVTFVITSREEFCSSNLKIREVPLDCLSPDEATKVLVSRVPIQKRQKLSKPEKLVELCGHVPLALSIAGPLLQDYSEEELISRLQQEPLDLLQDSLGQQSVEKAISASFTFLDENERNGLVLLSLFPGSFTSDSAKAVIEECSDITVPPARIMRSLRSKSLLQHDVSSDKHEIHLLIQEFAKKIGWRSYPRILTHGKYLVCKHFISRLENNAELYWGKDTCKQSFKAFNEDRHNFEYFLRVYGEEMEKNDPAITVKTTETFPNNFVQTSMYLEQCVLPSFYMELLERLLKSPESEKQHVQKLELFCLLGHEYRKVGSRDKYKDVMEKARNLYSAIRFELDAEPLSEVLFLNSNARFLSEQNNLEEPILQYRKALSVCEKLEDHPERAATLLFTGRHLKRRKERAEADEKLRRALDLFKKCLGNHVMTAISFKEIADFYLPMETEGVLDISLAYYQDALEMMKELGVVDRKNCVLTLKNFAACHRKKRNFDQAMDLLQKADQIAQRELEEDHVWKAMIKTHFALLHEEMGDVEKAISSMREGLEMCGRLCLTLDRLSNRRENLGFIRRHPEVQRYHRA